MTAAVASLRQRYDSASQRGRIRTIVCALQRGRIHTIEASGSALVGTLLLRQQAGEDQMGVGDSHGEGKQPLSTTCWSWSSR
jgi:hypothetical protein